ncbi:acyltransferase [Vibrio splendidus]
MEYVETSSTASPNDSAVAWIAWARLFACYAVIVVHVYSPVSLIGELTPASALFSVLARVCIPVFAILAGYLAYPYLSKPGTWRRCGRYGWPLVRWSVLYLVWYALRPAVYYDPVNVETMSWKWVVLLITFCAPYYHLWYLCALLITEWVWRVVNALWPRWDRIPLKGWVASVFFMMTLGWWGRVLEVQGYQMLLGTWFGIAVLILPGYIIGHCLRAHDVEPKSIPLSWLWLALGWTLTHFSVAYALDLVSLTRLYGWDTYLNPALLIIALYGLRTLDRWSSTRPLPRWLIGWGEVSFGVYLIHPLWLDSFALMMSPVDIPPLGVPVLALLTFATSTLTSDLLRRLCVKKI